MNNIKITKSEVGDFYNENEKTELYTKKPKKRILFISLSLLITILIALCIFLYYDSINVGTNALKNKYNISYGAEKETSYNSVYSTFFGAGEEKYHVMNRVTIEVINFKEEQKLEVLNVSAVEYIIVDAESNNDNIETWLEVPGEGTYIVDLKKGEFIVDTERVHVLVRVPYPELTNIKIDYPNVRKLLFKDDIFNGNYSKGEDLARELIIKAELLIQKEFASNQNYYLNAQKAACSTIENLVKQLNPKVPDIKVEVEFY